MFDRLRNKLHTVQENLTASIRGLSTVDVGNRNRLTRTNQDVNLDAGTEMLEKYQTYWAELHESAQENALKAEEVDQLIGKICKKFQKKTRDIRQIGTTFLCLPEVIHSVTEISNRIDALGKLFDDIEKALVQFEDLVETSKLPDIQVDHKEKKLSTVDNFKVTLAEQHAEKIRRHEVIQQRIMKERQEAFEDQFKQDMEIYKKTNTVSKISILQENSKTSIKDEDTLEDVELEPEDLTDLDEFLSETPLVSN